MGAISLTSVTVFLALGVGTSFHETRRSADQTPHTVPLGAFLGSGSEGVRAIGRFQRWLDSPVDVGHTYLPGNAWSDIEGSPGVLRPWLEWKRANPAKLLVLNVPMLPHNEDGVDDEDVSRGLDRGADGVFDRHFQELATRMVSGGAADAIIVPGWEMNGDTYTSRCAPNPNKWRSYWRRIVTTMRAVPNARFRFDFTATRGRDTIPWPTCYPGDDVVDIIGSDNYDQPAGADFDQFIQEPYGLAEQARFATDHKKPMSFPEWGMFRNSDDPDFVKGMYDWISTHPVVYETITDYCPHGVWGCGQNPRSSKEYRKLFGGRGLTPAPAPTPTPTPSTPSPSPSVSPTDPATTVPTPAVPGVQTPPATPPVVPPTGVVPPVTAPATPAAPPVVPAQTVPGPSTQVPFLPPHLKELPKASTPATHATSRAPVKPVAPDAKPLVKAIENASATVPGSSGGTACPVRPPGTDQTRPAVPPVVMVPAPKPLAPDAAPVPAPLVQQPAAATPSPQALTPPVPPSTATTAATTTAGAARFRRTC